VGRGVGAGREVGVEEDSDVVAQVADALLVLFHCLHACELAHER